MKLYRYVVGFDRPEEIELQLDGPCEVDEQPMVMYSATDGNGVQYILYVPEV